MDRYLILWRAFDAPSLLEKEEFDSEPDARAALTKFQAEYPWNTYTLAKVEDVAEATVDEPPGGYRIKYFLPT